MSESATTTGGDRLAIRPLHAFVLVLFGAFLTWPALSSGYVPSRDVLIHLLWSKNFADQLWAGDLYPRWLFGMNDGLGSPVFFFYAPLPYYLTTLLRPLFQADPEGWHQLGVAASLAVMLSGLSAYAWLQRVAGATAALIAAVAYMSAPYHLAFDLFQRFAFAELWAFVWFPLVMCGVHAIVNGHRLASVGLALAYAALLLTHLPSAMIFSPVPLAYAAWFGGRRQRARSVAMVASAMALGAGLSAVYVIPALASRDHVSFLAMREGYFSHVYNFLYYGPRFNEDFTILVSNQGWFAATMLAISGAAFALGRIDRKQLRFWTAIAVLAFAMMLPPARLIWDLLPPLQAIQFPWRFNTLLTLAMTTLIALWAGSLDPRSPGSRIIPVFLACAIVVGQSLPTLIGYLALAHSPGAPSMDKMLSQLGPLNPEAKEKVEAAKLGMEVPEYRPRWVPRELYSQATELRRLLSENPGMGSADGGWKTALVSRGPRHTVVEVNAPTGGWVTVAQFYYPGWHATEREGSALQVRPSASTGLLEVEVPPGKRDIVVRLETGIEERIGWAISAISVVLVCVLAVLLRRRHSSLSTAPCRPRR